MSDTRVRGSVPGGARAAGGGPRKKDRTHYL